MPEDRKIDYLELPARDLQAAMTFYRDAFDWQFVEYGADYCAFNDGRLDGGFYRSELSASTANGAVLVVLYADDLEAAAERVRTHGGQILREIFKFPGGRRFQFADPNGNELAVWSDH
ncbi:VOC family protein [Pseudomonas sp. PDM14]|uniref:VOC family protein n=1 Tax=Pseudomonas sp. PDM14 TaxID=2769288 RepID=UPI0017874F9C|nr:VOC family protein [Pseudomonas sp. PDM14]MBD9481954.1 VOC family protein [Pseudomonas sp. PDM14]